MPEETAYSLSDSVERAFEHARGEGHLIAEGGIAEAVFLLLSRVYLKAYSQVSERAGIQHIFGTPCHPQGRGKIERVNRRIKVKLRLIVYWSLMGSLRRMLIRT